jgi:SAM-dependent methyltransferase
MLPDTETNRIARRIRRSFSQKNLDIRREGPLGDLLAEALTVPRERGYQLTHAFHPYPGRFHPRLPRLVLAGAARAGETVLDPFMGGGTVLVEAILLGLHAIGNDLNPVAALVARERTRPRMAEQARRITAEAERIAALVESLRREKRPPRVHRPHLERLAPHYAPHLLAEMLQTIRLIDAVRDASLRESLRGVFSSLAVKFSNRRSDSSDEPGPAHYPKGAVSRFLVQKTRELAEAQWALAERLPRPHPRVRLLREDARLLPSLGWGEADHVLTSPPYPGTYDYHEHHRLRMDWLDLGGEDFLARELGPRREAQGARPPSGWASGMQDVLGTLARVLRPQGNLFVVIADWHDRGHGIDGAGQTIRLAAHKGWLCRSRASVQREVFHRAERAAFAKRGKWEHLLHFRRDQEGIGRPSAGYPASSR